MTKGRFIHQEMEAHRQNNHTTANNGSINQEIWRHTGRKTTPLPIDGGTNALSTNKNKEHTSRIVVYQKEHRLEQEFKLFS